MNEKFNKGDVVWFKHDQEHLIESIGRGPHIVTSVRDMAHRPGVQFVRILADGRDRGGFYSWRLTRGCIFGA